MPPLPRSVSDTELEVLKALWDVGPGTVRDIHTALADAGRSWAYTTVQTLLLRLEQKYYVSCDKRERAHVFDARVSRDEFLSEHLDELADRVCDGRSVPLVLSLVQGQRFTPTELKQFRELLDSLEPRKTRRKPTRRRKS